VVQDDLGEQSTYLAPQAEVAWLEKALFLAAQELAAFRVSAGAERERMAHALQELQARLMKLESERGETERRYAAELERAQARFEAELAERAQAWSELGKDIAQRGDGAAAANARWQVEVERTAQLTRDLNDARLSLKAALDTRTALLDQFSKLEEQFSIAAAGLREAKDQGGAARAQVDRLGIELDQSIARCRQLETEAHAASVKLNERSEDCESAERALGKVKQELTDAQTRIQSLERAANELQAMRPELEREREMRRAGAGQIERMQVELSAHKKRLEQTEQAATEARRAADVAQSDLQTSRRERDESRREHELAKRELERTRQHSEQVRAATEREVELERQLEAAHKERAERELAFSRDLDSARRDLENARREYNQNKHQLDARTQAELEAARKDRDEARRDQAQTKRELEARYASELENARRERDEARRELEDHGSTRMAMLDLEKDRAARLKSENEALREELDRTRDERETMREELAQQQKTAAGNPPAKIGSMRPGPPKQIDRDMTVPIPDRAPANEITEPAPAAPRRGREGTAYSVTHVEEEQVFVRKGGGGGRGTR
jgi:chromosome segregation ATPase